MALKLKLNPEPTFKAKVGIPVPGSRPVDVVFTFKHRTREEILEWIQSSRDATAAESVADAAAGWELDDEFTPENIERLCNNYPGAGLAIVQTYLDELRGARSKN
jgi:hypothetical protein